MAMVVSFTIQQCMKFEWDCQEIMIYGEWSHPSYSEHAVHFIEVDGVTFNAVEIMQTIKIEKNKWHHDTQSPYRSGIANRKMMKYGYKP